MPEFRGSKNLHLGFPVWAESKYDAPRRTVSLGQQTPLG